MEEAAARDIASLREWFATVSRDAEPVELLTTYVMRATSEQRRSAIVVSELYVAALRREHLREVAAEWDRAWIDLLEPMVGREAAAAASLLLAGLMMKLLLEPSMPRAQVTSRLRQVLAADCVRMPRHSTEEDGCGSGTTASS